jgi:chromosome segregation protein
MGVVRLASLTLEGFKSFAPRTHLSFPGAITAIIGPNGVGKSNICDAIAWVLGEQSARLLRSQTMADVIFNGAPQRPPAGSAQVTLELASGDGRWAEGAGTLELSRRVLRDGTSDYRIGGRRARLKDVVDNLMDAGLGTRSYAIIEQGRIGQVLSARATERRALFEEAAGISKFRVRRHEAELKLAETRANLLRVADVTSEVKRALDAARRQARQAERHRELRERLAALRAQLFAPRAQVDHDRTGGDRAADRGAGERLSVRREHHRAGFQAAVGEQDVRRDDD